MTSFLQIFGWSGELLAEAGLGGDLLFLGAGMEIECRDRMDAEGRGETVAVGCRWLLC